MKTAIFSGTSEGKELCAFFESLNIEADVYVATEYGKQVMPNFKGINVFTGRLKHNEMSERFVDYDLVIDATHPYAVEVSRNIKIACNEQSVEYVRVLREVNCEGKYRSFKSIDEAASFLNTTEGNIFVSTGSKEIEKFMLIEDFKNRVYARCLDSDEVKNKCSQLGFSSENLIFGKGPFTYKENYESFKKFNIKYLVTKQSGKNGGFDEKVLSAEELNAEVILILPPKENGGYNISEIKEIVRERYNCNFKFPVFVNLKNRRVVIIGCGNIAERRIKILSEFGANITVIADKIKNFEIESFKNVTIINRKFKETDLDGVFLAISATDDRKVNHRVHEICEEKNILASIADSREESTFFFPAICRNDDLVVGVTSDGTKHSLVKNTAEKIRRIICEKN